jgi:uroporphyrinogen-III synthase
MTADQLPLAGLRVVVTRSLEQSGSLAAAFAAAGARVEILPLLEVVPPADPAPVRRAAAELGRYDWLVFTSANAAAAFLPLVTAPWPQRLRVAAVGGATAAALRTHGIEPHLVPGAATPRPRRDLRSAAEATAGERGAAVPGERGAAVPGEPGAAPAGARAEAEAAARGAADAGEPGAASAKGLLAALAPRLRRGDKVLLPQAADARPLLARGLAAAGAKASAVVAYDKRLPAEAPRRAAELFVGSRLGWVTFTSPRIVRHFVALLAADWPRRRGELAAASIGGVTSDELRRHGVEPAAQAASPGDAALIAAVIQAVAR